MFGHWEVWADETADWKSFTYLVIDENEKKYIGAKTKIKGWENYKTSCKPLKEAIKNGLKCRFIILKFFADKQSAFNYEDILLVKHDCVKSDEFWNRCRLGKHFNLAGIPMSDETKSKLRESKRNISTETRQKLRAAFKGKKLSDEQKAKRKKAPPITEQTKEKIRQTLLGRKHSQETINLMKNMRKGEGNPKFKGWHEIDGIKHATSESAALALGISSSSFRKRLKNGMIDNYRFIPK